MWSARAQGLAQLTGRLRRADEEDSPGVGDWVLLSEEPGGESTAVIERVLKRRTVFTRGVAGREVKTQVIAANVDRVFVVSGLDEDFNVRRIERYLARIWASGAQPSVILNKADLCEDVAARRAEVEKHASGADVLVTSALRSEGLDRIRSFLHGGLTIALVGSSGAGKSTLMNALLGEDRMATGVVRASDGRGQHVTTHRQLVRLPGGGLLLDTPGMKELQLIGEEGLDRVFQDITALATQCRYNDCLHEREPGCAVKSAIDLGALEAERLEHFHKLAQEGRANALRHEEHSRRKGDRGQGMVPPPRGRKGGRP